MRDSRSYVRWAPLRHTEDCRHSRWLVDERSREWPGAVRFELRVVCTSCGVVYGVENREDWVEREVTTTARIGFGSPPIRSAGLWPGPAADGGAEPSRRLATRVKSRPSCRKEIAGSVSEYRTPCGAARWVAVVGYDPAKKNREGFRTVRTAVSGPAEQLGPRPPRGPKAGPSGAGVVQ